MAVPVCQRLCNDKHFKTAEDDDTELMGESLPRPTRYVWLSEFSILSWGMRGSIETLVKDGNAAWFLLISRELLVHFVCSQAKPSVGYITLNQHPVVSTVCVSTINGPHLLCARHCIFDGEDEEYLCEGTISAVFKSGTTECEFVGSHPHLDLALLRPTGDVPHPIDLELAVHRATDPPLVLPLRRAQRQFSHQTPHHPHPYPRACLSLRQHIRRDRLPLPPQLFRRQCVC